VKNKVFIFLIVFSLIVGTFGVYAASYDQTTSARIVPTVLKVSGDLSLSNSCSGGCYIKIFVNNNSVVQTIAQTEADLNTQLASGIYTNVFGITTTGTSKTVPVKVSVYTGSTELISATTDIPNPNYNMGPLTADYTNNLSTSNSPSTGSLLSYNGSALSWIPFLAQTSNIADSAITTAKLADGSVINTILDANSVTSDKILDSTIVGNDIANNTISANKIQIETPSGQCPVNDANLQWDATNKMFKWDATTYCSVQSVSLITITPIPQDLNEQVTVVSDPSVATQNGTCVWRIGTGPQNNWSTTGLGFSYTYTDPSNPCAGITVDTSKFPVGSTVGVGIDLTYGVSTKSAIGSFYVDNPTKPATCYDSYGNATICP